MKTKLLILLLLIPIIGMAQNSIYYDYMAGVGDSITTLTTTKNPVITSDITYTYNYANYGIDLVRIENDTSRVELVGIEIITINLLLNYEKECYNDSTISSLFFVTEEAKGIISGFGIDNREFLTWQDAEHSNYPNDNYLFTEENIWQWWVNKRNSSPYADYHISEKYIRCEKEYAHREPTFKGFLIWLKERNKL